MKSLILKDFYVLRKQLWLYAVIICLFQTFSAGSLIAVLYAALLPSSVFAYDDRSKWDMMEVMLPYSTREIVLSRYCVGWLGALFLLTVYALARQVIAWMPWMHVGSMADFRTALAGMSLTFFFLALSMPIYFRFDAEKSRLVRTLIVMAVAAVTAGLIAAAGTGNGMSFDGVSWKLVGALYLSAAILTALSVWLSMLAWKRRHR